MTFELGCPKRWASAVSLSGMSGLLALRLVVVWSLDGESCRYSAVS